MGFIKKWGRSVLTLVFFISVVAAPKYAYTQTGSPALRCENVLLSENKLLVAPVVRPIIEGREAIVQYISTQLLEEKIDSVINEFLNLYNQVIGRTQNQVMTDEQFSKIFLGLKAIADRYQIKIESKNDLVGVFPEGLRKVKISGFSGFSSTPGKSASFLKRHELAHLFHVLALRVVLIENSVELAGLTSEKIDQYIEVIEGGKNYLEFEKIVTDISGAMHTVNKAAALNERYGQKLHILMNGLRLALKGGKVKFPNGWSFVELYANFVSKAPLLLGKSFMDMSVRMSLMIFVEFYLLDDNFQNFLFKTLIP